MSRVAGMIRILVTELANPEPDHTTEIMGNASTPPHSIKGPTLDCLDHKVPPTRHEGGVPVGAAGLGPALVQAGVQPQTKLSFTSSYQEAVNVPPDVNNS